jgi:hypothetical protein
MQRFSGGGDGSDCVRFSNKSPKIIPLIVGANVRLVKLFLPLVDPLHIRLGFLPQLGVPPVFHLRGNPEIA